MGVRSISVIHPSRGRPEQAYKTYQNWLNKADSEFEYIISYDSDDEYFYKYVRIFINQPVICYARNKSAIQAINRAAKITRGDIIVVISDDFDCPEHWDSLLRKEILDRKDFVLKTRDGIQPVLVTLPIMDRVWYERYGYVYNPDYKHMYADTELTACAIMSGRILYSSLLFKHLHYTAGLSEKDVLNERNDATYEHGKTVFERHLATHFGIQNPVCTYESIDWQQVPKLLSILIATTASRS